MQPIINTLLDPVVNFGKVIVSGGYPAGTGNIAVTLIVGDGSKLPNPADPAGSFNLVWFDSSTYSDPADDPKVEIVRCIANVSDTLTLMRAQEGTLASTKNTPGKIYKMILAPTKKTIDDIQTESQSKVNNHAIDMVTHGTTSTIVGISDTQNLSNKTITDSSNNVTARSLKSASTSIDVSAAVAPSSGQVLTATSSSSANWQTPTAGSLNFGLNANKSGSPSAGATYISTDTRDLWVCFTAGSWTSIPPIGIVLASDQVMTTHNATATFYNGTPTLMKTITFNEPIEGVIRVVYTIGLSVHATFDEHNAYCELRFNDIPIGSNGRRWSTLGGYSESVVTNDITINGAAGSTLKVYGWLTVTPYSYGDVKNMSLRYTRQIRQNSISATNS